MPWMMRVPEAGHEASSRTPTATSASSTIMPRMSISRPIVIFCMKALDWRREDDVPARPRLRLFGRMVEAAAGP